MNELLRFTYEYDDEGHTVLRPLTAADHAELHKALENPKGITFGQTLEEAQLCPVEPEVPWAMSTCGIAAEQDANAKAARSTARSCWDGGDNKLAMELIAALDEPTVNDEPAANEPDKPAA